MTISEAMRHQAAQTLDQLWQLLDERHFAALIDDPIDQAVAEFDCPDDYSHAQFLRVITDFVIHLHDQALPGKKRLSPSQAQDEGFALLEELYQGTRFNGFYGAIADAADTSQPGLPLVLLRLAEAAKSRQRQVYTTWVASRLVSPGDWAARCAITALLLERNRAWLPPSLARCAPEQLATEWLELLTVDIALQSQLQHSHLHPGSSARLER